MTPEQIAELVRQIVREELRAIDSKVDVLSQRIERYDSSPDRFVFNKKIFQILDGRNIQFGTSNGTKIGTSTTQKIGFFNVTPVAQQANIADPSGGSTIDTQARSAINSILDVLDAFGFTA